MIEDRSFRKAIALDFDGVLHSYTSGWQGVSVIADEPVQGSIGWLIAMCLYSPYDVIITSTRCNEADGIEAMEDWISRHVRKNLDASPMYNHEGGLEQSEDDYQTIMASITFAVQKPQRAFIFIDDRAWKFMGTFPSLQELNNFKPWYK